MEEVHQLRTQQSEERVKAIARVNKENYKVRLLYEEEQATLEGPCCWRCSGEAALRRIMWVLAVSVPKC